jgi:peptidyl-prolyl cis-trans isomerase D
MGLSDGFPQFVQNDISPIFAIRFFKPTYHYFIMSIIQRIREKGALISAIVIALALLGFIAMDAFSGRNSMFGSGGGPSSTIGSVNGRKINANDFRQIVTLTEQNMVAQQGGQTDESTKQRAVESAWEQEVNRILQEQELDKLGLSLSKKEISDLLYGPNPSPIAKQYMGGQDGSYSPEQVRQTIRQVEKGSNREQKTQLAQLLKYIEQSRLAEKYTSLLTNSINAPKWKFEKQNADNSQLASISFVRKPYTDITDSTVKVSDDEIRDYINKNKDYFKQEESRGIAYVSFNAAPSAADTAEAKNSVELLKPEMASATDIVRFLAKEGVSNYYDGYISSKRVQIANKDSIFKTPVGQVYGPYADGANFTLARVMGAKQMPDTVNVRHILVATIQRDPQTGQDIPVRDSATAAKLMDSIQTLLRNGAIFDSVCAKLSDDAASKDKGGVYENVPTGQMVPPFNDFIFGNPVGYKGVVKTEFGLHYIEILSQKGGSAAYKVAYLSKPILVSSKTDADASSAASQFAGNSPTEKAFNETFEKQLRPKGYNKGIGFEIKPNDAEVRGLGVSRQFVRKIYAAKKGEVLQPEKVGNYYVVAVVTEVNEKGLQSLAKARVAVEPVLKNKKKAELIKKQIGTITTLEAAAAALGKQIEPADSLRISGSPVLGYEPKITGVAFNPANRGKVVTEAIEGQAGVYVVRVNSVVATPLAAANVAEQRKAEVERAKQQAMYSSPFQVLKEAASIKDNRSKEY